VRSGWGITLIHVILQGGVRTPRYLGKGGNLLCSAPAYPRSGAGGEFPLWLLSPAAQCHGAEASKHPLTEKSDEVSPVWPVCMALEICSYLLKSTAAWTFTWTLCVWFRLSWGVTDLPGNLPLEVMALS